MNTNNNASKIYYTTPKSDFTGKRFGYLTVLGYDHSENSCHFWKCRCDCGNEVIKRGNNLLASLKSKNNMLSCGCKTSEYRKLQSQKMSEYNKTRINPNTNKFKESDDDIIGKKFGRLTVLQFDHFHIAPDGKRKRYYLCRCDCGNEKVISYYALKYGNTTSCGNCGFTKNLAGQKFGRLRVIYYKGKTSDGEALWKCRCDCGNEVNVRSHSLLSGNTRSCGCLSIDVRHESAKYKNREAYPILTSAYNHIVDRCTNPQNESYYLYKDKEVEWKTFEDFYNYIIDIYEEAINRYGKNSNLEIDRIDNTKGYISGNIRYIPKITNNLNKRNNEFFEYTDQLWTTGMFAEYLNTIKHLEGNYAYTREDIVNRLRNGWTFDMLMHVPNKFWTKQDLYNNHPVTSPIYDVETVKEIHKSSQGIHPDDIDYIYNNGEFNNSDPNAIQNIINYNKEHYLFPHLRELGKM